MRGFFESRGQMWRTIYDPTVQNFVTIRIAELSDPICPPEILAAIKYEAECEALSAIQCQSKHQENS